MLLLGSQNFGFLKEEKKKLKEPQQVVLKSKILFLITQILNNSVSK